MGISKDGNYFCQVCGYKGTTPDDDHMCKEMGMQDVNMYHITISLIVWTVFIAMLIYAWAGGCDV